MRYEDIQKMERKPVFSSLVGSHNYNLAIEDSDRDYKLFVLPTYEDLYAGRMYSAEKIGTEEDYNIHDIRKLPQLLWKANVNFLEVLFSEEIAYLTEDSRILKLLLDILQKRNELATMNIPYLYKACKGMAYRRIKDAWKNSRNNPIGYDPKCAATAIRVLDFLVRLHYEDFHHAIWYPNDSYRHEKIIQIKEGKIPEKEIHELYYKLEDQTDEIKDLFLDVPPQPEAKDWLDGKIKEMVWIGLQDEQDEEARNHDT